MKILSYNEKRDVDTFKRGDIIIKENWGKLSNIPVRYINIEFNRIIFEIIGTKNRFSMLYHPNNIENFQDYEKYIKNKLK